MNPDQKLDLIIQRLNEMDDRLSKVENKMNKLDSSVRKMDGHVDFVETVYDSIKFPFHSLMGMVKWVGPSGAVPEIENTIMSQELIEFKD